MAMMHFLFSEGPKSWEDKPLLIPGNFLSPRLSQWEKLAIFSDNIVTLTLGPLYYFYSLGSNPTLVYIFSCPKSC